VSGATNPSRTHLWLESLGDWSWPGRGGAAAEALPLPPSWVPAFPPRLEPALVGAGAPASPWQRGWATPRRLLLATLLSALAAVSLALALKGPLSLERLLGLQRAGQPATLAVTGARASGETTLPLPSLAAVSHDAAGSSIDHASYSAAALHGEEGSFTVYLPPGYASTTRHYPVLYLLHGYHQPATAFLQMGLQEDLDRLIVHHAIPPMIAVMIQGGHGPDNWRNLGRARYEDYVLEVQGLIDRMLPTVAARGARAIAGDSMGGYGAMNVALGNPYRFAVVESWLGFFNNLDGELRADRPIISHLGLRAFLYGAESDTIADPSENPTFAAALRAAGASARSAVYPGEHNIETLQAHLESMLRFAGRALFAAG
jgi:enterochelin esterase-like enzyme